MAATIQAERTTEPRTWPTIESVEENLRQARRAVNTARHAAEDAASEAALKIRRHPLRAVGAAVTFGMIVGGLVGLGAAAFWRRRD